MTELLETILTSLGDDLVVSTLDTTVGRHPSSSAFASTDFSCQVVELIDSTGGIDIPRPSTTNAGNKTPVTGTAPRAAVLGLCSWVLLLMW